ncbi:alpha/beta fold hydrolase [Leptobacterium flavescens]|uniref:Alpha/beta fold hydrolase n=1 Tax=Leptobacterium flavescens TaxID=472055 RepID=A0A6P0UNK9_9FLAO|nr:alpha/beta fold hydrolase [Leptobacterium flavescens]NER12583.1 alpha/beta fold hydrolase [Leptobacterium flavescens]
MDLLHSRIVGEGTPLLILHGFLGMSDNWKTLANYYAKENIQVHLIDQRNHGRSFHSDEFSYELTAEDLLHYCNHHQLNNVNIIGHSMGGKTAMLFAVRNPEKVARLLVADIAPRYYPVHHQTILQGLNAINFNEVKSRGAADEVLSKYIPEIGVRQFLLKNLYWKSKEELAYRFNLPALTKNIENIGVALPEGSNFEGPTLFLRGSKSDYISDEDLHLIKEHFPQADLDDIENAGHWLHAENPKQFFERSLRFLQA